MWYPSFVTRTAWTTSGFEPVFGPICQPLFELVSKPVFESGLGRRLGQFFSQCLCKFLTWCLGQYIIRCASRCLSRCASRCLSRCASRFWGRCFGAGVLGPVFWGRYVWVDRWQRMWPISTVRTICADHFKGFISYICQSILKSAGYFNVNIVMLCTLVRLAIDIPRTHFSASIKVTQTEVRDKT